MKKLCFGTYASVLVKCMPQTVTQKQLVGTMLLSVNDQYDIRTDDAAVSALVRGRTNVSEYVSLYIDDKSPAEITACFRSNVIPMLDLNKQSNIVLAIRSIIAEDVDITDDREIELVNGLTKADILSRDSFVLADFLAGIFIYTVKYTANNKQESNVKEITDAFIKSFDKRRSEISFIASYGLSNNSTVSTVSVDAGLMALIAEAGGFCPRCGISLSTDNSTIMRLNAEEEIILCLSCAGAVQASEDETDKMIAIKQRLRNQYAIRDAVSDNRLSGEIKELLTVISGSEPDISAVLAMTPLKVEKKITDRQLLRKVLNNVVDGMYEMVNEAIEQLAAENKLNVKSFRKSIKRMFEDADDTGVSQSDIFNGLVEHIYTRAGKRYYEACEILISYFVQSCEVFHEITG